MRQMVAYIALILLFAVACQKEEPAITIDELSGLVQKGPYINGSSIVLAELNSDLNPTGLKFSSQIVDNKGSFGISEVELNSQFVEIRADGFYFNEETGDNSEAQLTLFGLADISDHSTININILTQMEKSRVEYLVGEGLSFRKAKIKAQAEVLNIFGLEYDQMASSELLDISKQHDENGILLAISLILQAKRSVGGLTEMLANIGTDLREDGMLDSDILKSGLLNQAQRIDAAEVRENLENRYESLGVSVIIPDFEKYLNYYLGYENPIRISFVTKDVICNGQGNGEIDITVEGGTLPYTFEWSNGERVEDLVNLSGGSYSLKITDAMNYMSTVKDIKIYEPDSLLIVLEEKVNIIPDQRTASIDISVVGGNSPFEYTWSNGAETEDLTDLTDIGEYELIVRDTNSCSTRASYEISKAFVDQRDDKEYTCVIMGDQIWMAQNLAYLPAVSPPAEGSRLMAYYYVNAYQGGKVDEAKATENFQVYGVLYNWEASQDVCPAGWHLPSDEEWKQMEMFVGMSREEADKEAFRGSDEGARLKERGTARWNHPNTGASNEYGFTALPGSQRYPVEDFGTIGSNAQWWTSDKDTTSAYTRLIESEISQINRIKLDISYGLSIRCVKD